MHVLYLDKFQRLQLLTVLIRFDRSNLGQEPGGVSYSLAINFHLARGITPSGN